MGLFLSLLKIVIATLEGLFAAGQPTLGGAQILTEDLDRPLLAASWRD